MTQKARKESGDADAYRKGYRDGRRAIIVNALRTGMPPHLAGEMLGADEDEVDEAAQEMFRELTAPRIGGGRLVFHYDA